MLTCREATRLVFWPSSRGDSGRQGRYCPSRSAPTPCGVSAGKIGKCVTALHRHFRSALSFSSLLTCTHDANAHVSTVVRRHLTPGAIGWWNSIADCANALVASGEFRCPVASMPSLEVAQKKSRFPVAETKENGFEMPRGKCSVLNGLSGNHHSTSVQCESNHSEEGTWQPP